MTKNSLRQAFSQLDISKKDKDQLIPALLGFMIQGRETVEVPARPGYVYARIRSNTNELLQVFNDKVSPVYDLPVLLIRDPNNPTRYKVDGRDIGRYDNWGSSSSYLPRHANTHSFSPETGGGGDIVWVYGKQFMPLAVVPSGSYGAANVLVSQSSVFLSSEWKYVGNTGTSSLVSYKPTGSFARMVLVYLNEYGNPGLSAGSTYFDATYTGTSQVLGYIPNTPANSTALAGIRLVSGTSVILWDNIYDLRPFMIGSDGSTALLGHTIQDDGVSQTTRTNLNFVGNGFVLYDDAGNNATVVSGTSSSSVSALDDLSDVSITTPNDGQIISYSTGTSNWINSNVDRSKVLLWDNSASVTRTFPSTDAGVIQAFSLLEDSDVLWLPPGFFTLASGTVLPTNVKIIGCGAQETTVYATVGGYTLTMGTGNMLNDFRAYHAGNVASEVKAVVAASNSYLINMRIFASNTNSTGTAYALTNPTSPDIYNCLLGASVASVYRVPYTALPYGYFAIDYPNNLEFRYVSRSAQFGSLTNYVAINSSGIFMNGSAGNRTRISLADVSNPPLDAELDSAFGQPASVGSGFFALVNDNGGGTDEYLVVSDGASWWYTTLTKAL